MRREPVDEIAGRRVRHVQLEQFEVEVAVPVIGDDSVDDLYQLLSRDVEHSFRPVDDTILPALMIRFHAGT